MRYRVRPLFWQTLYDRRIRGRDITPHLPNSQQWFSWVSFHPEQTVSFRWARAAARYLDLPLHVLFEHIGPAPVAPDTELVA